MCFKLLEVIVFMLTALHSVILLIIMYFVGDDKGLFSSSLVDETSKHSSTFCSESAPEFKSYPVKLTTNKTIPLDIEALYQITLISKVIFFA